MSEQLIKWRFAIDRGGTFTDVVGVDPEGNFHILKLLSRSPHYPDASIEGIRRMFGLKADEPLPGDKIAGIRFGTTIATNTLLERKGERVALLITKGFADLLDIGYQNRPDIFKLCIKKPSPLFSTVIEVDERIDCNGKVIRKLNKQALAHHLEDLKRNGPVTVAVVLMHSWRNPAHELLCEKILRGYGFSNIILSHKTINLIKIVSRGQSAVVDAYLNAALKDYLGAIERETGAVPVEFMQSNGALSLPSSFAGKDALLSGPAGGVTAVAIIAKDVGARGVIGFDMGGTSTDVSRFEGEFEKVRERTIGGITLQTETLNIVTVAAGGGSILGFDGQRMLVGPESAGSDPGPTCYGFGGPLTITDANIITGRLLPDFFPKTFGPGRNAPLDIDATVRKFSVLTKEIDNAIGSSLTPEEVAAGFLRIADEKMAMAIKEISVSKGFDVRKYVLLCFGGAGGQHACSIASLLDIDRILIHPLGSVMSAYGIGLAQPAWKIEKTVFMPYDKRSHDRLMDIFEEMENKIAKGEMPCHSDFSSNKQRGLYQIKREVDLRPKGADMFLTLEYSSFEEMIKVFCEKYEGLFGFSPEQTELEVVNLRVEIRESTEFFPPYKERLKAHETVTAPAAFQEVFYDGRHLKAPVYLREEASLPANIKGPAIIIDTNSTVVIDPGFEAKAEGSGVITIKRFSTRRASGTLPISDKPDPVLLEVFNNLFMGIATEMGITLKNTAHSVNIKERLDFSCAVFDSEGGLVANAHHIPVHLGSMSDTVKAILEDNLNSMRQGDVYISNNPYRGGSHLPDITAVCPIFSEQGNLVFLVASRGHHADIGGKTPGSMPPYASHIDEEGVLIDNLLIVRDGIFREDLLQETFTNHRHPVRNISERISDLKAQIAACHKGVNELMHAIERYGVDETSRYMRFIQENAAYSIKRALQGFLKDDGCFCSTFEDFLDDGTRLRAAISIYGGPNPPETVRAMIDFTGTGPQHIKDNLNTPSSVTRSAVLYVLRSLIDCDIPLNDGCFRPVNIVIPEGSLLNPVYPAPVASGNVETSQRIVDVLLGALGIAAASQGTMNNLLFEVEGESPYYETIAGGSGALQGCPGSSGVHVHMTNTRMTDPEIFEIRHQGIRLERFALRKDSGGKGKFPGGDGVIREIKFLKPATVSILSERRVYSPYGMKGGEPGKKGLNLHKRADGSLITLGHREVLKVEEGESVVIETPGGGGWGEP